MMNEQQLFRSAVYLDSGKRVTLSMKFRHSPFLSDKWKYNLIYSKGNVQMWIILPRKLRSGSTNCQMKWFQKQYVVNTVLQKKHPTIAAIF